MGVFEPINKTLRFANSDVVDGTSIVTDLPSDYCVDSVDFDFADGTGDLGGHVVICDLGEEAIVAD